MRLRAFAFVFLGERLRNLRLIQDPFDFADTIAIDLAVFPMFEEPLEALLGGGVASLLVEFAEKIISELGRFNGAGSSRLGRRANLLSFAGACRSSRRSYER